METPQFVHAAGGIVGVFSTRSPDSDHERNEDAAAVIPIDGNRAVLAVADGVGGGRGGDVASGIAVRKLHEVIETGFREGKSLRACIVDGFEEANRAVVETGVGAASTFVVVEIDSGNIRSYHAGDSVVLAVGLRGKIRLQTVSHSPVGYAVESGMINEREAMEHDDRHLVSNVLGVADMRIEIGTSVRMARRDTVLLASDGLTDNLRTDEIIDMIRKGSPESVMRRVAAEVTERMRSPGGEHPSKADDLTFMIYRRTE
jgi:serine/threonine protein phosphatase PrpC